MDMLFLETGSLNPLLVLLSDDIEQPFSVMCCKWI